MVGGSNSDNCILKAHLTDHSALEVRCGVFSVASAESPEDASGSSSLTDRPSPMLNG